MSPAAGVPSVRRQAADGVGHPARVGEDGRLLGPVVGQVAVVGDRRPYVTALIVLDPDAARAWAATHGLAGMSTGELARHPDVLADVQRGVDMANECVSQAEHVRRFRILPAEWTPESGELTPTLKLKRRVIGERYAADIEQLYR